MQLFLDMDGVLADFDKRAEAILGCETELFEKCHGSKEFWRVLQETPDFYNSFDKMPDADQLFDAVKHLKPIILTGIPLGDWAEPQKREWCRRMFPGTYVITCRSKDKSRYCFPGDVIVDDRSEYRHLWQKRGTWIKHTDAESSIRTLRHIGVIE